jgi:hypothetical protein
MCLLNDILKILQSLKMLPLVIWRHPESGQWRGPDKLLTWECGYGCIQEYANIDCVWVPGTNTKPYNGRRDNQPTLGNDPSLGPRHMGSGS